GDTLTICFNENANLPRPDEFRTRRDSDRLLFVYRRTRPDKGKRGPGGEKRPDLPGAPRFAETRKPDLPNRRSQDPDPDKPFDKFPFLKRPPLTREPVYWSKTPKYAVLAFGPKAETRMWLVLDLGYDPLREKPGDKDSLYLDLNGNGDLTDPAERVPVEV